MAELTATKPGWKTSEFWMNVAGMLLGAVMASGVIAEGNTMIQAIGGLAVMICPAAYAAGRGLAKKG